MSSPRPPSPARLVVGLFTAERELLHEAAMALSELFGPLDAASPWFSFHHTSYYEREFGSPLFRRLMAFKRLADQGELCDIKLATNEVEKKFLRPEGSRRLNLDPGLLTPERFVLATGKNYVHRVYLAKGIYADLTLVYRRGVYEPLEWTYPDYAEACVRDFLLQLRRGLLAARKTEKSENGPFKPEAEEALGNGRERT